LADNRSFWDSLGYGASTFLNRVAEQSGLWDVVEEFGKYDDADMSSTTWLGDAMSVAGNLIGTSGRLAQQAVEVPFQSMANLATEASRAYGAVEGVLTAQIMPRAFGEGPTGVKVGDPAYNRNYIGDYFTGGISPEKRDDYRAQGMSEDVLRKRYEPISASDALVISADKIRNKRGEDALWNPLSGGLVYKAGELFNPKEGLQRNGSYLPAAFDMWAQDAGVQVWERSDMTHQLIAGQVVVETAIDPMNYLMGPMASMVKGLSRPALVFKGAVDPVAAAQALDLVGTAATDMNTGRRITQWVSGRGTWNAERMLTNMSSNPRVYDMLTRISRTSDPFEIRRWLDLEDMAHGEGADALATVMAHLDNEKDVASLLYAAAYRDEAAMKRVLSVLESKTEALPVVERLKTLTGTGRNILERTMFEFGNGNLPDGHLLNTYAKPFLDDAIDMYDLGAGIKPGDPGSLRAQWDALADATKEADLNSLVSHQQAMRGAELLQERLGTGEQVLRRLPNRPGVITDMKLERARTGRSASTPAAFAEWLRTNVIPSISVNGRAMRTTGRVYLLAKPGLTFSLHGLDALDRFDGLIQYADGIIGSASSNAPRGLFSELDEVKSLREQFVVAGAVTNNPEQIRAGLVNRIQQLAVEQIAVQRGWDPEAAALLAERGLEKARLASETMNDISKGYTSTVLEDGRPLFMAAHPTTIRQTANHIPIMDLKSLDDAMKAHLPRMLTSTGEKISVATAKGYLAAAEDIAATTVGKDVLQMVGRAKWQQTAHQFIDLADAVNTFFKMQVLMRLGYPVRNLSEAHLSAFASGVGWLGVMKHAHILEQIGNFSRNRMYAAHRYADRVKTYWGIRADEDAMIAAARATEDAIDHQGDRIAWIVGVATNPTDIARLVNRINADPGDAEAVRDLRTVLEWRARMTHALTEDMGGKGLLGTDPALYDEAMQSATYYHADTVGGFDPNRIDRPISVTSRPVVAQQNVDEAWEPLVGWDPSGAWEGGLLTGSGTIPSAALSDAQRSLLAGVEQKGWSLSRDGSVRFQSAAGVDHMMEQLQKAVADARDRAADLRGLADRKRLDERAAATIIREEQQALIDEAADQGRYWVADPRRTEWAGVRTVIRKEGSSTYTVYDQTGRQVLGRGYPTLRDAKVAVLNEQIGREVTSDIPNSANVTFWAQHNGEWVSGMLTKPDTTDFNNFHSMTLGELSAHMRAKPPMIWVYDSANGKWVRRKARKVRAYEADTGAPIQGAEEVDLAGTAAYEAPPKTVTTPPVVHEYTPPAKPQVEPESLRKRAADLDRRSKVMERARLSLVERGQWAAREKELAQSAKKHRVQYRADDSSPWVDWKPGATPFRTKANASMQFRRVPGTDANPRRVQIDAWSPMLDLTDDAVVNAVIENYPDFPLKKLGEARAGDRKAQEALMDVFAKEGFYRVKWPEGSSAWDGEHIMLHPDAIGEKAMRRHVDDLFEAVTAQAPAAQRHSTLLRAAGRKRISQVNRKILNEIPVPESMRPRDDYVSSASILADGGFEAVMDEALQTMSRLRQEQATLHAAYLSRKRHLGKIAKKHGPSERTWVIPSMYGAQFNYRVADALHGGDGGAYAQVTAGTLNQTLVYAQGAHHADLLTDLSRASMRTEEIHPGDPRYFDGLFNFFLRHGRDLPGAVTPMGLSMADFDPLLLRAMGRGDREQAIRDAVDWALHTREGRDWVASLDLVPAGSVDDAIKYADEAAARRRATIPKAVTREDRRTAMHTAWGQNLRDPQAVADVDVADLIRAQFNFVDNYLPNQRVRDMFLSGKATPERLRAAYDEDPWQLKPFNGLLSPTHGEYRRSMRQHRENQRIMGKVADGLTRQMGKAMEAIGTKPETMMARHPVFMQIAESDLKQRVRFAEETSGAPISLDQLLALRKMSQRYALREMEKTLYTMKTRGSVDEFLRFVVPFFPAWRNTVHRWGRFAGENPAGVARVARLYTTTVNQMPFYNFATGEQVNLDDGTDPREVYTLMPGLSALPFVGRISPTLAEAMRMTKVNQSTWDVVFQGDKYNPGLGPWAAVPMQAFMEHNLSLYDSPMGRRIAKWFLPIGPQSTGSASLDGVMSFMPSYMKPIVNQLTDTEAQRSLRNKIAATYVANGHDMGENGQQKSREQMSHDIDMAVLWMNGIRTLSYLTSPVATQQIGDHEFYSSQYRSLLETSDSPDEAETLFLERFGSDKFIFTEPTAYNYTGGMSTTEVVENQRENEQLADEIILRWDNPKALGFFDNLDTESGALMPYDSEKFNPYARNWQLKNSPGGGEQRYRGGKRFDEYVEDAEVSLGWQYYDEGMDRVDLLLSQAGYTPGTPAWSKERAARSSNVAAVVGRDFPEWANSRGQVNTLRTEQNADLFRWVVNESEWGKRNSDLQITRYMKTYLQERERVRAEIAERQRIRPGWPSSLGAEDNADLSARLLYIREEMSLSSPTFKQWVNQFFRTDNITYADAVIEQPYPIGGRG
jgi:hypothetical protein